MTLEISGNDSSGCRHIEVLREASTRLGKTAAGVERMSVAPMLSTGDGQAGAPEFARPLFQCTDQLAADSLAANLFIRDQGGDIGNRRVGMDGCVGHRAGKTDYFVLIVTCHEKNAARSVQLREPHWYGRNR